MTLSELGIEERTEAGVIEDLTNGNEGRDVILRKSSAIVKKKTVVKPREEPPAPPVVKRRRGRPPGKKNTPSPTMPDSPETDLPAATSEPTPTVVTVGTYHGRGAPPEGVPVTKIGTVLSNGRVRVELVDGRTVTCFHRLVRRDGAEPVSAEPTDATNAAPRSAGRPNRLTLATRELTRVVLAALGTDPVTVTLSPSDALALIGHEPCEFCGTPVPFPVGICDSCVELRDRIKRNPDVVRKMLRRTK